MRILYGVEGTGNAHLTRARAAPRVLVYLPSRIPRASRRVINVEELSAFLACDAGPLARRRYPDVALAIADWIVARRDPLPSLAARLWCQDEGDSPARLSAESSSVAFL